MTEIELIAKIKELKQIKPNQDWVILTKNRIFEEKQEEYSIAQDSITIANILSIFKIFRYRPVLVPITCLIILIGIFGFAQNTVPGDFLYPVKRAAENTQVSFSPESQKSKIHLELANKRLEELNLIAKSNRVKDLAPTIEDFQANVSEAAKNLVNIKEPEKDPQMVKDLVIQAKKLEANKEKVETLLGTTVGGMEELNEAYKPIVEGEIKSWEGKILTENQQKALELIKEDYQNGNYSQALEKILLLFNNQ